MNNFKKGLLAAAISLSAISGTALAAGSNTGGGLKGAVTVQDTVVANATIVVTNEDTGLTRTVQSDASGNFRMPNLPVGKYKITVTKDGFKHTEIKDVVVRIGADTAIGVPMATDDMEEVQVLGSAIVLINTSSAETGLNITTEELSRLPVARTVTDVALLAPGTVRGDNSFGTSLASFGGASVSENTYYINGMNVTNFRNGLGGSRVPFEFYDAFEVKTGGYSAEFGRSTGGVVNAVTKSGSNTFEYGVTTNWEPEALSATSPDTRFADGTLYDYNSNNSFGGYTVDMYAAGPIIEDKLFFAAIYEPRNETTNFATLGAPDEFNEREQEDAFWGVTLDWNIADGHALKLTSWSDERDIVTKTYAFDPDSDKKGEYVGTATDSRGGENIILNYSGQLTDTFAISAMIGENNQALTSLSTNDTDCPLVVDVRGSASSSRPGCEVNVLVDRGEDTREAMRLDAEWAITDAHLLRFGVDQETNSSEASSSYSGGIYYRYLDVESNTALPNGGVVPDGVSEVVRTRIHENGGSFETISRAFYIEDTWNITDSVTAVLGLRNEYFNNKNSEGESFIEIDNQWAPRLGIAWDINGDGDSKLYANIGRYHLPVANNTNVRLAGGEYDASRYFVYDGQRDGTTAAPINVDADGIPTTQEIGSIDVASDGSIPDTRTVLNSDIEPMYQDEFIVGYETMLNDDWMVGARVIRRDLSSTIEDVLIDQALAAMGLPETGAYILTNPGSDATVYTEIDDMGTLGEVTLSAEDLAYPAAERYYNAVEMTFERMWDGVWTLKGSYTWSQSYGNAEGYVKSDNGQDDAGILQDFDFPELMDGAYGYLPNDRRHQLKVFGAYQLTDELTVGLNYSLRSGRPVNAFGVGHPSLTEIDPVTGDPIPHSVSYGDTYYLWDDSAMEYTKVSRGSMGRTDWTQQFDVSAVYRTDVGDSELELRADVFNLFNADSSAEVYEFAESTIGVADKRYGLNQYYQKPLYMRLGASLRF